MRATSVGAVGFPDIFLLAHRTELIQNSPQNFPDLVAGAETEADPKLAPKLPLGIINKGFLWSLRKSNNISNGVL